MLSSRVETVHSDDLLTVVGAKTWVPQNFEDSEQATHSAIPVFAEETEVYSQRAQVETLARMSRAADFRDSIDPNEPWTKEELEFWGVPRFELLPSEVVCNDGIIRPKLSLQDHISNVIAGMDTITTGTETDEFGLVTFSATLPGLGESKYIAGIDPKLIPTTEEK